MIFNGKQDRLEKYLATSYNRHDPRSTHSSQGCQRVGAIPVIKKGVSKNISSSAVLRAAIEQSNLIACVYCYAHQN